MCNIKINSSHEETIFQALFSYGHSWPNTDKMGVLDMKQFVNLLNLQDIL